MVVLPSFRLKHVVELPMSVSVEVVHGVVGENPVESVTRLWCNELNHINLKTNYYEKIIKRSIEKD